MTSLQAYSLLMKLAGITHRQQELFSRKEIEHRINEIKYLSSQKKIPKLTLRKEIIHLENKLKDITHLEEIINDERTKAAAKIAYLKRQNAFLKRQLSAAGDKNIVEKVNRVSHLLVDTVAQKEVAEQISLSERRIEERQDKAARTESLKNRIDMLKQELDYNKIYDKLNPEKVRIIEQQIAELEEKLLRFAEKSSMVIPTAMPMATIDGEEEKIKHDMLFHTEPPQKKLISVKKELPLPPPPQEN